MADTAACEALPAIRVEWCQQEVAKEEPRPGPRWGHAAVVLPGGGDLLITGGTNQYLSASAETWLFHTAARRWRRLETVDCPPLSAHTASVVPARVGQAARIVCFGGDGDPTPDSAPHVLDTGTWTWSLLQVQSDAVTGTRPAWRRTHAGAAVGDAVWLVGGATATGFLNDIWSLDLAEGGHSRWSLWQAPPGGDRLSRRASHSATWSPSNSCVFVFGGYNGQQLGDLWAIDAAPGGPGACRKVRAAGPAPDARSGHAAVHVECPCPLILFVGGERVTGAEFYHDIIALDTGQLAWAAIDTAGSVDWAPRGWCSASWAPEAPTEVLVFGGGAYHRFLDDLSVVHLDTLEAVSCAPSPLGADLCALLDSGQHADLVLVSADGASLPVHRAILSARSKVFRAMLGEGTWAEAASDSLPISCSEPALRLFLRFLYGGTIPPPAGDGAPQPGVLLELLELAAEHLLEPLVRDCAAGLARALRARRLAGPPDEAAAWLAEAAGSAAAAHEAALMSVPGLGGGILAREAERLAAAAAAAAAVGPL